VTYCGYYRDSTEDVRTLESFAGLRMYLVRESTIYREEHLRIATK